jgi:ABC-type lipoprotein export system ATPase subunit
MSEPRAPAVEVADLFCLYTVPGGATVAALRGMSLHVSSGERLVVHGPNGSGKTTLLRVLIGEAAASSGSARVAGTELVGASATRLAALRRDLLGFVDQHSGRALRPELDVLDNVALQLRLAGRPRSAARSAAAEALDALDLSALAHRRPATLSAGEAQRVAVCAAVSHGPVVILADEPTGELDVDSADAVYDLLASAAKRAAATLLLVTHDDRAARIGDRVIRIRDGRLSEQWRPSAPQDEELVVDDRGWLRLPEPLRQRIGLTDRARVRSRADAVEIVAAGAAAAPAAPPALAVPAPVSAPTGPLAELSGIELAYGERSIFADFSATIAPATLTVVRGRSGAGKSTLLALLLGLAAPDVGTVTLGGRRLAGLSRTALADVRRALVGVSTQSGALTEPLDTWENLAVARAARGLPRDEDVVRSVVDALGLDAVSRRPVRLLSGGERQRVAIARTLVAQRPLIVLDEPTSQQDEAHAELVTAVLVAAAAAGAAVVAATHDPVLAAAAGATIALT